MTSLPTFSAFVADLRLHSGSLEEVLRRTWSYLNAHEGKSGSPLIFDDRTGRLLDFDFRGSLDEVLARALPAPAPEVRSGPGRPKLGVVSREVSLLPRHWEWLEGQRGGASAALRRLIDEARKADPEGERRRQSTEAAGRFMTVMAGDRSGYEEASRALYGGDLERLRQGMAGWPGAVRDHVLSLLDPPLSRETDAGVLPRA
ncbi:MAG: DUF2239 family protein [Deinococcus sp.]